ncbi:MAG: aminotransferase IV [Actinomycetales bacterium]|nr:aminotransferase IV [Actinomycetales bacterium]
MSTVIWHDGRLVDPDEPLVTAVDHGLTVGDGIFETCAVYDGGVFALKRHLARLARSAAGLGIAAPNEERIREGIAAVLRAAPDAGRLRITVTDGPGPLGSFRDAPDPSRQTVLVVAGPAAAPKPARVVRVPWVRNERSAVVGLKTTSYAENVVVLAAARAAGADEALLANTVGELCEGTASNVFVERGGELVTPPLTSGCLAGITRELVLEWSQDAGLPVREAEPGELRYDVLDEVSRGEAHLALAGSIRNLVPVVALDGVEVAAGETTRAAMDVFAARRQQSIDP